MYILQNSLTKELISLTKIKRLSFRFSGKTEAYMLLKNHGDLKVVFHHSREKGNGVIKKSIIKFGSVTVTIYWMKQKSD